MKKTWEEKKKKIYELIKIFPNKIFVYLDKKLIKPGEKEETHKIILDNLSVPGLIGVGSKFKNCASFFKYVDNEMQINQKFKEEGSTNLKTLTEKVETRLKKVEGDITQILQNVNQICDVKFEKIFHKIEEILKGLVPEDSNFSKFSSSTKRNVYWRYSWFFISFALNVET